MEEIDYYDWACQKAYDLGITGCESSEEVLTKVCEKLGIERPS